MSNYLTEKLSNYKYQYEIKLTAKDIYVRLGYVYFDDFYEVKDFSPPQTGDTFITDDGYIIKCINSWPKREPRLILQKKKKKAIKFTLIRRDTHINCGEWYELTDGSIVKIGVNCTIHPANIYSREEVEE